jgi:hypothetical protein
MKTKLILLLLLIVSISCSTKNKPVSDTQKEKIKGEIKEVVNTFIKGCEEANADMVMESFLDSPDFVDITNGMAFSYKEMMNMKPNFDAVLNQKCTIVNEKYTFLDKLTVLYTAETRWSTNYKDGHSSVTDPQAFLIVFKKIDNRWKVICLVDSNVEKNVPGECSKGLNQLELIKQYYGSWKGDNAKDTTEFYDAKPYGTGLEGNFKYVVKGEIIMEGKQLWGYDKVVDKYIFTNVIKGNDFETYAFWFVSKNKYICIPYSDINNPEMAFFKLEGEFKSPNELIETTSVNNKPNKPHLYTRVR